MNKAHNLDIHMYSLQDLLNLFELDYNLNTEDLKRAKKKVLMTHPDKSRLDPKYFLFYKKAFELIVQFYQNQHKDQNEQSVAYDANKHNSLDENNTKQISKTLDKMDSNIFQEKFNQLFEENMVHKPDPNKNSWFTNTDNDYEIKEQVNSKNMKQVFENMKNKQNSIVKYGGVKTMGANHGANSIYENEDDYISTDPFSKLKFDDLRKVHKDETVMTVSENDYQKVPKYNSVDQFVRARGSQSLEPIEKQKAERLLAEENQTYKQQMMQKEYDAKLKSMEYEQKNKSILSNFLRLTNK
tara:strand:+ start:45 stop:938 length:894 start_codon:yes stop_codon:yes gene_type:complete